MNASNLESLEQLYDVELGNDLPLPPELATFFGHLQFPTRTGRPYVIGNFVTTLDGVVALKVPGHNGGGDISGFNQHDQMVMGLLRAVVDAVIVGAGTLRAASKHLWTAAHIYPPLTSAYQELRTSLGKSAPPLTVFVTEHGNINLDLPVFQSSEVPVLIVTTKHGWSRIHAQSIPPSVQVSAVENARLISAGTILEEVKRVHQSDLILVEGGPQLMGDFFAEQRLDELFLTLSPQIAGRDDDVERPGLVAGKTFAPDRPLWGKLVSVKRGGSHLFLRYAFDSSVHT